MTKKVAEIVKKCDYCKKDFLAKQLKHRPGKFCSQGCQRKGRNFKKTVLINGVCQFCQKHFTQPKYWKSQVKFCSIKCMAEVRGKNMRGENHPRWKGGDNRQGSHTIGKRLKKAIGECERCFSKENLHIHHVIPVSERPDLSADSGNIEILCAKCHAQEHPEFSGMLLREKNGISKVCVCCGTKFYVPNYRRDKAKFCTRICHMSTIKTGFLTHCERCKSKYRTIPSKEGKTKFCSNSCRTLSRFGK